MAWYSNEYCSCMDLSLGGGARLVFARRHLSRSWNSTEEKLVRMFLFQVHIRIFILGSLQSVISPMTSLTSTHSGHRPCPGDTIIFTCITNGSSSHAWRSDEYIGVGGIQLEFATFDNPGVIRTPSNNPASSTLARLVAVGNREQRVLQSKLELTVTADYNKSTISCINVDRNLTNKTTIEILGRPGVPEDLVLFKASNSFGEGSGCFVFVQWSPPTNTQEDDVTHYIVDYSLGRTLLRSTSYEFRIPNCTVELAVNITAVSRCGSLGGNITQIVPLLPSAESALVTEGPASRTLESLGVAFGVLGLIFGVWAIIVSISLCFVLRHQLNQKPCHC